MKGLRLAGGRNEMQVKDPKLILAREQTKVMGVQVLPLSPTPPKYLQLCFVLAQMA
jgi:hypothetical protein